MGGRAVMSISMSVSASRGRKEDGGREEDSFWDGDGCCGRGVWRVLEVQDEGVVVPCKGRLRRLLFVEGMWIGCEVGGKE